MYFQKFPNIYYEYNIAGQPVLKVVKDISANVRFRIAVLENITLFDEYDISEGETPEIIAHKVYGSSEYHWIVMLCNQRFNYVKDFPLPYDSLNSYILEKYNRFNITSWVYSGRDVTAVSAGHGITFNIGDTVSVINAFVTVINSTTGVASRSNPTSLEGQLTIVGVTSDTITFRAHNNLTGVPDGGFTLFTNNLEQRVHHHENEQGFIVNSDAPGAFAVTNYEHEVAVNETKRRIKLISPQLLASILTQFNTII